MGAAAVSENVPDVKITVEAGGHKLVLTDEMFEDFSLSIPSDVITEYKDEKAAATRELGRVHIALVGLFKEGVRPQWEVGNG